MHFFHHKASQSWSLDTKSNTVYSFVHFLLILLLIHQEEKQHHQRSAAPQGTYNCILVHKKNMSKISLIIKQVLYKYSDSINTLSPKTNVNSLKLCCKTSRPVTVCPDFWAFFPLSVSLKSALYLFNQSEDTQLVTGLLDLQREAWERNKITLRTSFVLTTKTIYLIMDINTSDKMLKDWMEWNYNFKVYICLCGFLLMCALSFSCCNTIYSMIVFSSCLTVDLVCMEFIAKLNLIKFGCILVLTEFNNDQMEYTHYSLLYNYSRFSDELLS